MKGARLWVGLMLLIIAPTAAFAQAGVTPLLKGPFPLAEGQMDIAVYISIEDDLDLFGIYRYGIGPQLDLGLRAGYTDAAGGGLHIGGELRYGFPQKSLEQRLAFAIVGGLQFSIMDRANLISVPFGVSIGAEVGSAERPILVYGLPFLEVDRIDPDGGGSDTQLEFGVQLGADILLTPGLDFSSGLTIASHDNDNISLALGLIFAL